MKIAVDQFHPQASTLYITATPIGNLQDITIRALSVLSAVDFIICEDTRKTSILLNHYGINRPLMICHEHTPHHQIAKLVERLLAGQTAAVVSDAGMPIICDPGSSLLQQAISAGIKVTVLPGASALTSALALCGLPINKFTFYGFVPEKPVARRKLLNTLADNQLATVFFESAQRVIECLQDIATIMPGRTVVLLRELSKLHEEVYRGDCNQVLLWCKQHLYLKGEIVLVLAPATKAAISDAELLSQIASLSTKYNTKEISAQLVKTTGESRRRIYQLCLQAQR